MRSLLLPLVLIAMAGNTSAQAPLAQAQPPAARPTPQEVVTNVTAISATTAGRLWFWVRVPGGPPEGQRFRIRPDRESPYGASAVLGLLMTSYQTTRLVRIFYIPPAEPGGVGEIVGVDTPRGTPVGQVPPN
jgi:hypothetical protein